MERLVFFRRILISFLLLVVCTISWAYNFEAGGIYYSFISDEEGGYDYEKGVYVDGSRYNIASLVIPSIVRDPQSGKKYKVTGVGFGAFRDCESLRSISIPNSVEFIGSRAFENCANLLSVTIPNSVTSIGFSAFEECRNLTSIKMSSSVTSIGSYAFQNCTSLTSITIPNGVTTIAYQTFLGCSGLTSITIGSGVTSIDGEVFSGCTALLHIICYAKTPPDCRSLDDINKQKCKLSVPSGCKRYYQKAYEWKDFLFIYEDTDLTIHNS